MAAYGTLVISASLTPIPVSAQIVYGGGCGIATTTNTGCVKPDGTTTTVNASGVLSVIGGAVAPATISPTVNLAYLYPTICTGSDDSSSISAALSTYHSVALPPASTCLAQNISIGTNQQLDLNKSTLNAEPGATYLVKLTGFNPRLTNGQIGAPSNATLFSTTTTSAYAPGTTTIGVASVSGFSAGNMVSIALANSLHFVTTISSVGANSITLVDAIPSYITSASVSAGGTGYDASGTAILSGAGGKGSPGALTFTSSGGIIGSISAVVYSGQYATTPTNPVPLIPKSGDGKNGTATLTYATNSVSNGAAVSTATGLIWSDAEEYGGADHIYVNSSAVALQVSNQSVASNIQDASFSDIRVGTFSLAAIFVTPPVYDAAFTNIEAYGTSPTNAPVGVYQDTRNPHTSGGMVYSNVKMLQTETGFKLVGVQNFQCMMCVADTLTADGIDVWNGTGLFGNVRFTAAYAGTDINGMVVINQPDLWINGLQTHNNSYDDLYIDASSAVQLADTMWGPGRIFAGDGTYNNNQDALLAGGPGAETLRVVASSTVPKDRAVINGFSQGNGASIGSQTDTGSSVPFYTTCQGTGGCQVNQQSQVGNTRATVTNTLSSVSVPFKMNSYIVTGLPTCNSGSNGYRATVTDASSPTYLGTVTGGSSTVVGVMCNGTNWVAD